MPIELYEISIANYLQGLGGVAGFLQEGLCHFSAHNIDPNLLLETRLFPDMRPFRYQVVAAIHHSADATKGLREGNFGPPDDTRPHSYRELLSLVADARAALSEIDKPEIDAVAGGEVTFRAGDRVRLYSTENFVLSFSLPQFYFHVTTAYNILRSAGVPIGKRHYMGEPRLRSD